MRIGSLKVTAIAIALISLAVVIFMWARLSGPDYGFFYGVFQDPPMYGLIAHGPNYYQSLNIWYSSIFLCLCLVVITKFFRSTVVGGVLCILLLAFITISTWEMTQYKNSILEARKGSFFWSDPHPWLNSSVYSDWLCIVAFVVLLVIEIWMVRLTRIEVEPIENRQHRISS